MKKLIINCAVTGGITMPSQTPYLPLTPRQIADEAIKAGEAGAAMVHIHARNPEDGKPSSDARLYKEIITRIKEHSNIIVGITSGGAPGMNAEQRMIGVREFKPELASMNMGTISVTNRAVAERFKDKEFKYAWEKDFVATVDDDVLKNTFQDLDVFVRTFKESQTKPGHEAWCVNQIYNVNYYYKKGLIELPIWLEFVMGSLGAIAAIPEEVIHMKQTADRLFGPENYEWSAIGVGYPAHFTQATLAIIMGGHVRVGLEDNIFLKRGVLAKSNAELVERAVRIANEYEREVATPDEVRKMLKLKGSDKVNF